MQTRPAETQIDKADSLHGRFAAQAQRWPARIALRCEQRQLSYGELNRRADHCARQLREAGLGPGDFAALALPRGIEAIVYLLATLKVGAAYVPIDPGYPAERLRGILQSCRPRLLLCTNTTLQTLREYRAPESDPRDNSADASHPAALVLPLPEEGPLTEEGPLPAGGELPAGQARPVAASANWPPQRHRPGQGVAYCIFTSGSTGQPKGVLVGHSQVTALLDAALPRLDCDHRDIWSLFHSLAFDFSVWELWGALTTGAQLSIVPQATTWSADNFADFLRREQVSILNQTPSAFYALSQAELSARAQGAPKLALRKVIFGGEALNPRQLLPWWQHYAPGTPDLINMYGITETTVHVTWMTVTPDLVERGGSPIGEALSSLEVLLLDPELKGVPEGETGEMYVAGSQVALGYLGRPELTASRFIAHPERAGQRLYRSGDLALRRQGQLYYCGRADRQLKIRGFRIEAGEVEAALAQHPAIQRCAVLAQPVAEGQIPDALLAFFVLETPSQSAPSSAQLRQFLAQHLPSHCLPSQCIAVDTLPLTVNGKLDQSALLQHWQQTSTAQQTAPRANRQRMALLRARLNAQPAQ